MVTFTGNILIIGCGAVAQCSIPLILKHLAIPAQKLFIIDPLDKRDAIIDAIQQGAHFAQSQITQENFASLLSQYLKAGDICIDLANQVDTYDVLSWCVENNILYMNSCLNNWPSAKKTPLYQQFERLTALAQKNKTAATSILSHGANPGLISSFVKKGLVDFAHHMIQNKKSDVKKIEEALATEQFNQLAQALAISYIHITEVDSQNNGSSDLEDTFTNTWSTVEFINECIAPIEFAWGTHETRIPPHATVHEGFITFPTMGLNSEAQSSILDEAFSGLIITHDETHSIANYLSIREHGTFIYRPTSLFIYSPCPAARNSLQKISAQKMFRLPHEHIMTNEINNGLEKMGCLLMSPQEGWWTGSMLSIEESNRLLPGHNSTVLQVAAGVIAALEYMVSHPSLGICFPEQLDYKQILAVAKPYLGELLSRTVENRSATDNSFTSYVIRI